uniref:HECT-type E3 ubiquitin transferase n=1 Tax=Solanum lycopersicum TaxID=4081 RepID=K4DH28_SOLLC
MFNSDNNRSIIRKRKRTNQTPIQLFVRSLSKTETTLVLRGYSNDTVEVTKNKIRMLTGIPEDNQRLIYNGRHLSCDRETLSFYNVENDTTIHLFGKMRRSTYTWKITNEMISRIATIMGSDHVCSDSDLKDMEMLVRQFSEKGGCNDIDLFISSSAPADLVKMYVSPDNAKRHVADESIRGFINSLMSSDLQVRRYNECARIILAFCKELRSEVGLEDLLYSFCRSSTREIVAGVGIGRCKENIADEVLVLKDVFMFVREVVVADLSRELELSMIPIQFAGISLMSIVHDFLDYMRLVRALMQQPFDSQSDEAVYETEYMQSMHHILSELHVVLYDLLDKIERCLRTLEDQRLNVLWLSQYLVILKELSNISKFFNSSEIFWQKLSKRKVSLCYLIEMFAKSSEDYRWIIEHKEVTNFKVRRNFTMMMLEEARDGYKEEAYGMIIDRSMLLDESFEYIVDEDPALLRGDLLLQFKHEEAVGPGVLREWFFLVCREMFNPHRALFVACPNDRRRFFPNSASKVDPMHLEYFTFCGRMVALALMHKIQIGVVFDRVFFLQLAGEDISLEDIRDADPSLYSSWKMILKMDPETVDQDILSLTFAYDVEEMGSRTTIELRPNGKDVAVNSKNRKEYVNLVLQHRFVTSIASQIAHFSQGFSDVTTSSIGTSFFRSLYLEDLDKMLDGSGTAISVEDWKAHTDYDGYEENDLQISWFWKIVEGMSAEKKNALLFFWTSIRYLPLEGFRGLDTRLSISRSSESCEHLPYAQTCVYLLRFPPYINRVMMQNRLDMITQEHVGCSFGSL